MLTFEKIQSAVFITIYVSIFSTLIAFFLSMIFGYLIAIYQFQLKKPIVIRSKEILDSFDPEKDYKATSKKYDDLLYTSAGIYIQDESDFQNWSDVYINAIKSTDFLLQWSDSDKKLLVFDKN